MLLTFDSASDLARALRRAADAHGQHREQTGRPGADWPNWYAQYLELEQAGLRHLLIPGRFEGATVPVAIVTSRTEAELIVGMLRNYDLRALVSADDAGGQDPALQNQGVRVLVAPSDDAAARQLIAAAGDTSPGASHGTSSSADEPPASRYPVATVGYISGTAGTAGQGVD
jgi:hypothetical protein